MIGRQQIRGPKDTELRRHGNCESQSIVPGNSVAVRDSEMSMSLRGLQRRAHMALALLYYPLYDACTADEIFSDAVLPIKSKRDF